MLKLTNENVMALRQQFPALQRKEQGKPAVFLDGPAGSQVPQRVADAVSRYMLYHNANRSGKFPTSRESDDMLAKAHRAAADFVGAKNPDEIIFGANMTTITFQVSRALSRTWEEGDRILVTRLDHDANVTPWVMAARDAGVHVDFVDLDLQSCRLSLEDFSAKLTPKTKLTAFSCASNSVGTMPPIQAMIQMAHQNNTLCYLDATHLAPHMRLDVTTWDCDFLICSAYKFFGPHIGVLWGRLELLEAMDAYKVRPAPGKTPGKWMTGTQNHACIAGVMEAIDYLADIGRMVNGEPTTDRRRALNVAFEVIAEYERGLAIDLIGGLTEIAGVKVYGITNPAEFAERVPTVVFTVDGYTSAQVAEQLSEKGIFAWHGNYYALQLSEALGREPEGMTRLGLMHYNTSEEVQRTLAAVGEIAATKSAMAGQAS